MCLFVFLSCVYSLFVLVSFVSLFCDYLFGCVWDVWVQVSWYCRCFVFLFVNVCEFVYMCMCNCLCLSMSVCLYLHMCVSYLYMCTYLYTFARVCQLIRVKRLCFSSYLGVGVCVGVGVCACVCLYVCAEVPLIADHTHALPVEPGRISPHHTSEDHHITMYSFTLYQVAWRHITRKLNFRSSHRVTSAHHHITLIHHRNATSHLSTPVVTSHHTTSHCIAHHTTSAP